MYGSSPPATSVSTAARPRRAVFDGDRSVRPKCAWRSTLAVTGEMFPLQINANGGFTKMATKKNKEVVTDQDLTDRLILSQVFDVTTMAEEIEQLKVCIYGLARQRGLVKK